MNIAAIGIGAGAVSALGVGFGTSKITDSIAERNPTGSTADGKVRGVQIGAGLLGVGSVGGGMFALMRGNLALGAGLIGAGIGAVAGTIGSAIHHTSKHGIGVETAANDIISSYDRNWNGELDLNTTWRTPEYIRRVEHRHEHDGNVHYTYSYYSIDRLTNAADVNRDGTVTSSELRDAYDAYDTDGNGRLQGEELKRADREVGEQSWYGGWWG